MTSSTLPVLLLALSMPVTQPTFGGSAILRPVYDAAAPRLGFRNPTEIGDRAGQTQVEGTNPRMLELIHVSQRFTEAYRNLAEYAGLPFGWDGDAAVPASDIGIGAASGFLEALPASIPEPKTMISADGEVAFYWVEADFYAEAGFSVEGKSYFFSRGGGRTPLHLDDHEPGNAEISDELSNALVGHYALAA